MSRHLRHKRPNISLRDNGPFNTCVSSISRHELARILSGSGSATHKTPHGSHVFFHHKFSGRATKALSDTPEPQPGGLQTSGQATQQLKFHHIQPLGPINPPVSWNSKSFAPILRFLHLNAIYTFGHPSPQTLLPDRYLSSLRDSPNFSHRKGRLKGYSFSSKFFPTAALYLARS